MIPSPSKRRKSNSSIPIPVGASNTTRRDGRGRTSPSRSPSRRSFQAPTRSSLARYHPDVLSKVIERSASEKAQRSSGQDFSSFGEHVDSSPQISGSIPLRPLAGASRTEPEADDGLPLLNSTISRPGSRRQSFAERPLPGEISRVDEPGTHGKQRVPAPDSFTDSHDASPGLSLSSPEADPPPRGTIAQFNGSPSQRAGTAKKQQFKKAELYPIFKTKKPKNTEAGHGAGELQPDTAIEPDKELPREIQEKKKLRDSLKAQLARLKGEVALLEEEAGRLETPDHESVDESSLRRLIGLLLSKNPSCAPPPPKPPIPPPLSSMLSYLLPFTAQRSIPLSEPELPPSPPPENPYAMKQPENFIPYLTIFAPLILNTETITSTVRTPSRALGIPSDIVQTYHFILQPPANFPLSLYKIPLILNTDPEKQAVLSISVPEANSRVPGPLKTWIASRLSNLLLQHDVSGLCWGICRYWEAAISRSKFWIQLQTLSEKLEENPRYLEQKKKFHRKAGVDTSRSSTPDTDGQQYAVRALVQHFERTSYRFSTSTGSNKLELLVSCPLTLDLWTSEPQLEPSICISGSSLKSTAASKIEKEAKRVFQGMIQRGKGGDVDVDIGSLVKAVEAVIVILFGLV
ncbi:hypothetical protein MGYG_07323 [Nannizzia gypsea CBS 118893]|uniref:Uncharacterized protein n=1 Tax=Arthroderma gypseum (strain ATCC MYA-4604 / CBS 118893) TaxID=535722 RepID=E4V2U2_ARTGP|nr:hypothetical protein MGYG_07323 [Nannizzia gypsea CBS 118893]EFR04316.1 hypothetical protein MGYG_07323 [Nannizzia gypsea CBS 118893]